MNNRVLMVWSGGCDSTLALLHLLKEKKEVRTLSITHTHVQAMNENLTARTTLRRELAIRGYSIYGDSSIVSIQSHGICPPMPSRVKGARIVQPQLWLGTAAMYLEDGEDLAFGYIRTDDFWHKKQAFDYVFTYTKEILGLTNSNLLFPLEWHTKSEVVKELHEQGLLKYCWTCEMPNNDSTACGGCTPCKHMTSACRDANIENPFFTIDKRISATTDCKISDVIPLSHSTGDVMPFEPVLQTNKVSGPTNSSGLLGSDELLKDSRQACRRL